MGRQPLEKDVSASVGKPEATTAPTQVTMDNNFMMTSLLSDLVSVCCRLDRGDRQSYDEEMELCRLNTPLP